MLLQSITGFTDQRNARDFAVVCLNIFVMSMSMGLTYPLLAVIMEGWGTPATLIGLNASMFALAIFLMSPIAGRVVARFGVKPTLAASLLGCIVCILLFKAVENLWVWFVLRFLLGTAEAFIFVITEIWVNSTAPNRTRSRLISIYGTSLAGGFLAGSGIVLATGFEGWLPFLIGAALPGAAILAVACMQDVSFSGADASSGAFAAVIKKHPIALWGSFAFGAIETGMFALIVVYGVRNGLDERAATVFMMMMILGNILLQFPLGLLADRMKKLTLLLVLAGLSAAGTASMPVLMDKPIFILPVLFLIGGMIISIYNVSLSMIGSEADPQDMVNANAAMSSMYGLGAMVSPTVVGSAMQMWDPHGYAVSITVILVLYCGFLLVRSWSSRPYAARISGKT